MSTPALVKFENDGAVYIHWDGYPESIIPNFQAFLREVQASVIDTRFEDASYLAAKYVVWQARNFCDSDNYLDFISLGIANPKNDYGQYYTYVVNCGVGIPTIELERK